MPQLFSARRELACGVEVAAHGELFTRSLVRRQPLRTGIEPRWVLLDIAPRVLPELDRRLSATADRVLRRRGVEVRTETSVKEATREGVLLSDGDHLPLAATGRNLVQQLKAVGIDPKMEKPKNAGALPLSGQTVVVTGTLPTLFMISNTRSAIALRVWRDETISAPASAVRVVPPEPSPAAASANCSNASVSRRSWVSCLAEC